MHDRFQFRRRMLQGLRSLRGMQDMQSMSRLRHAYPLRRVLLSAIVILLLVPAGVLAVRSLFDSFAAADEVKHHRKTVTAQIKKENKGPFGGTPARKFSEGEAAIVAPQAVQVGSVPPETVGAVLGQVSSLLSAGRMGEAVLHGDPSAYVSALAESTRQFALQEVSGPQALGYVTRLAPGYTLASAPRASGTMNVAAGENGELIVTVDYVWAYALEGEAASESADDPGANVVMLRTSEQYFWYPERGYLPQDRGLRPGNGKQFLFNADCEYAAQGLLALPRTASFGEEKKTELSVVYDPTTPLETLQSTC